MENQPITIPLRTVGLMLILVIIIPFLPLLISQQWDWWEAWVYAGVAILGFVISRVLAARRHRDLLTERSRSLQHADTKTWDKSLSRIVGFGGGLMPLVAGLDARFGWSPSFSLPLNILALVIMLAGYALASYALVENRFFSGVVRIQTERGHHVVSSGPYRWVRHPGYAGGLLTYLATPFFLNSWWTFLPVAFLTVVMVVRTSLEDKVLQDELAGYRDYAKQVRYRLLPGIW